MKVIKRWSASLAVFVVGLCCLVAILMDLSHRDCNVAVRNVIPSLDKTLSAVVFEMECGATVAFNTQVSISPFGEPFSREVTPPFFVISGQVAPAVVWVGDKMIEIHIPVGATVFRGDVIVNGISVIYR